MCSRTYLITDRRILYPPIWRPTSSRTVQPTQMPHRLVELPAALHWVEQLGDDVIVTVTMMVLDVQNHRQRSHVHAVGAQTNSRRARPVLVCHWRKQCYMPTNSRRARSVRACHWRTNKACRISCQRCVIFRHRLPHICFRVKFRQWHSYCLPDYATVSIEMELFARLRHS